MRYRIVPKLDERVPRMFDYSLNEQILEELKTQIALRLLVIDLIIITGAGVAGYFLAGRTLRPIEKMVEDQKRFVSDASHELRTPLTALKTEIEVALRSNKLDQKTAKEILKSNLEEVDKMQKLSNYLLSLNKYQNGKVKMAIEKVRLNDVVKRAIGKNKSAADEKKIIFETDLKEVIVGGDSVNLEELLIIFLDNAIKYSHKNGKIIITTRKDQNWAKITIKDFGMGIASADLSHIFDRFYRSEESRTKTSASGFGLGLSIANEIVKQYGGRIDVKSKKDEGSIFSIFLPVNYQ
jgi:signal transduction histidine kinase